MRTKICYVCQQELPDCDFWKIPKASDGLDSKCKDCRNMLVEKRRKEKDLFDLSYIKLSQVTNSDHYQSYKLLERMGYELESDKSIHEQFCDKYGLKIKKRDKPHTTYKSWLESKKNPQ